METWCKKENERGNICNHNAVIAMIRIAACIVVVSSAHEPHIQWGFIHRVYTIAAMLATRTVAIATTVMIVFFCFFSACMLALASRHFHGN